MIKQLKPLPDFLVDRYKNWKSSSYLSNEDHFKDLATLGHPMYQKTKEVFQHDIIEKIQANLPNPSDSPSFVSV